MNKISALLLVLGAIGISAYASNEATMESEEADARMTEESAAAESKAEAEMTEAKADAEMAQADMAESGADTRAEAGEAGERSESEAGMTGESMTSDSAESGNLVSTCTHEGKNRIISVIYDNADTDTVCEVTYEESSGVQTLWSAYNERDYCKEKAAEFVDKQEGWGWSCSGNPQQLTGVFTGTS